MMATLDSVFGTLQQWLAGPTLAPDWLPFTGPPCIDGELCWDPSRVILASAAFHMLQFVLLGAFFALFSFFRRLSQEDKVFWLSSAVSTTHSTLASAGAIYSIFFLGCYDETVCHARCHLAELSVAFSIGYFFYDYALMFLFHKYLYSHVYLVHHFLGAILGSLTFVIPACQYIASLFLLSESSTPFVNMRWFLEKIGMKDHPLYLINGITMTVAFFTARLVLTSYFAYEAFGPRRHEYATLPQPWLIGLTIAVTTLTAINTMWFSKMARGLVRALRKRRGSAPSVTKPKHQ